MYIIVKGLVISEYTHYIYDYEAHYPSDYLKAIELLAQPAKPKGLQRITRLDSEKS